MTDNIKDLYENHAMPGKVVWIGIRPAKNSDLLSVQEIEVDSESGIYGDHYTSRFGKRQVTLFQWEHLEVLSSFTGISVGPEMLRRNLVIRGINLLSLKKRIITLGNVNLLITGLCHPCSKMEKVLGLGGYNAMRGHGGVTAQVMRKGKIQIGNDVKMLHENRF